MLAARRAKRLSILGFSDFLNWAVYFEEQTFRGSHPVRVAWRGGSRAGKVYLGPKDNVARSVGSVSEVSILILVTNLLF